MFPPRGGFCRFLPAVGWGRCAPPPAVGAGRVLSVPIRASLHAQVLVILIPPLLLLHRFVAVTLVLLSTVFTGIFMPTSCLMVCL